MADLDTVRYTQKNIYGILFYVQSRSHDRGSWQLDGDIDKISNWYDEGLRVLQMAYGSNENNDSLDIMGYGSDEDDSLGVTDLGASAIKEMNRLRMVVHFSHCNKQLSMLAPFQQDRLLPRMQIVTL
ncbi:MAG: microsomal dipeptidase-like Zn-dependent dipeptidase [Bacteroidia bacterium]|jgi:microsomal dipeptidase-like Zn-dependent dipeptidase